MPASASLPSAAPLTRRQLREAERRAEQVGIREAAARATSSHSGRHVATTPLDGTVGVVHGPAQDFATAVPAALDDAVVPTEHADTTRQARARRRIGQRPAEPPRTRAERRTTQRPGTRTGQRAPEPPRTRAERRVSERRSRSRSARPPVRRQAPRWVSRAAVLGALGAATIVAPLADGADHGVAKDAPPVAAAASGATLLDSLDAAAQQHDADSAGSASALLADSSATARALVQSSRSVDRDGAVCSSLAGSGANGAGAALHGEAVVMPLAAGSYTQSSRYGHRVHPINGAWSMHAGLDFSAPLGTDIHSVADGVVVHAGDGIDGRSNMLVIIQHEINGETVYSWYVHMYADGVFVEPGQQVRAGEVIGEVGNNGNSTGPHLHLEFHLDEEGTTTDPGAFLADNEALMLSAEC